MCAWAMAVWGQVRYALKWSYQRVEWNEGERREVGVCVVFVCVCEVFEWLVHFPQCCVEECTCIVFYFKRSGGGGGGGEGEGVGEEEGEVPWCMLYVCRLLLHVSPFVISEEWFVCCKPLITAKQVICTCHFVQTITCPCGVVCDVLASGDCT